jgi:hypothetical protein
MELSARSYIRLDKDGLVVPGKSMVPLLSASTSLIIS